ncbi:16S rRNA (uracil(1498)-N(3))-methyltransferase [Microcoleus sp. FACHB-831]|uniref:16S rRNA (uracil(1498)-N(3))-methyltransferase n=1 Tax=Microcoleus sp. FACHB-831 TaxID=2692827 RepID=UPI001682305F|nr:16S rRNA (uracil(1498)-N(3))-methyltransferase [Microcoleus sp. FACHB-831]MBD1923783.1 16S rRNA (uracil(1498)-N(3))-methyltransferase [Microcoleus sp. FACHB-831]
MGLQRLAIAPHQLQNQQIILNTQQQHYLNRVLRLKEGDRFIAMDGQGQWWLASLGASAAQARIIELLSVQNELPVTVTLMVALPKGNGFDEVVRQMTELGVVCIAPTISDRTLLNPSPQKLERWRRIAGEAAEQSERQIVPTILDPVPFATSLSLINTQQSFTKNKQYICVARGESPHFLNCLNDLRQMTPDKEQINIVIATGPEGGWTPKEVESAIAADFQPVSLGRRILRAVTAPLVALSLVAAAWEQ